VLDIALFFLYIFSDFWISLFLVPVIAEFFFKKYSLLTYIILVVPLFLNFSVITVSLAYSLLLIRLFRVVVKNFGGGDVKALQTIAVAVPLYPHLLLLDSLFTPVLAVTLIASLLGTFASFTKNRSSIKTGSIRMYSPTPTPEMHETDKFWINGQKRIYKIPFVTFIAAGFTLLLILSLLRLV
jgi:hypothetical protein